MTQEIVQAGSRAFRAEPTPPHRLDSLTSLRFIAAAMVVCFHAAGRFGFTPDAQRQPLQVALSSAVSLFFVLSGFILAYNYVDRLGPGTSRAYYRARVARIWPLHLTCLASFLLLDGVVRGPWRLGPLAWLPAHALLMQSWLPINVAGVCSFNAVTWSLSVEWAFYLAFPLLLPAAANRPVMLVATTVAGALAVVALAHGVARYTGMGAVAGLLVTMQPLARLPEFALGMVLGCRTRSVPISSVGSNTTGLAVELAVASAVVGGLTLLDRTARIFAGVSPILYTWLTHVGAAPLYALLIVTLASAPGPIAGLLCAPICVQLGELSFALFLTHLIVLSQPYWLAVETHLTPSWLGFLLYGTVSLTIAWLFWRCVEVPARAWLRRSTRAAPRPSRVGAAMELN